MQRRLLGLCVFLGVFAMPHTASADITAFLGLRPTPNGDTSTASPGNGIVRGIAVGLGVLIIGFEFEYANTAEDSEDLVPGLQTGSGNILIQTPIEVSGVQLYATGGGGLYRERLIERQETHFATNIGGGVKIRLLGPFRVRTDYRVFRLQGDPLHKTYHRFYVGGNLAF